MFDRVQNMPLLVAAEASSEESSDSKYTTALHRTMLKTSIRDAKSISVYVALINFIVDCKHISYTALTFFIYFDDTCLGVAMSERQFLMFSWFAFFRVTWLGESLYKFW